jgi:hypothetical protein
MKPIIFFRTRESFLYIRHIQRTIINNNIICSRTAGSLCKNRMRPAGRVVSTADLGKPWFRHQERMTDGPSVAKWLGLGCKGLTTLSADQTTDRDFIEQKALWMVNCKGHGRKLPWSNSRHNHSFPCRNWGYTRILWVGTVDLWARIWTRDLPNTEQECQLLDQDVRSQW